jgi:tRNA (guanine37-N1)-methyltransferase
MKKIQTRQKHPLHFHVVSLFPEVVDTYASASIIGRARREKKINMSLYNIRDFSLDKHRRVDGRPYGGGPGMVLEALPVLRTVKKITSKKQRAKIIFFSPSGKHFDSAYAKRLAKNYAHIVLVAGHYEGIDERARKALKADSVSIGPYTLTGGEVPAMVVIDAVSRFIPGVLGDAASLEQTRTASPEVYTRPDVFEWNGKKYRVPKVLLSGDHRRINEWRGRKKS